MPNTGLNHPAYMKEHRISLLPWQELGELLYPDYTEYDLQEEITKYYKLFYGCDLTNAMYQNLIADALPK